MDFPSERRPQPQRPATFLAMNLDPWAPCFVLSVLFPSVLSSARRARCSPITSSTKDVETSHQGRERHHQVERLGAHAHGTHLGGCRECAYKGRNYPKALIPVIAGGQLRRAPVSSHIRKKVYNNVTVEILGKPGSSAAGHHPINGQYKLIHQSEASLR